ncbi:MULTISPECIES: hypothetical protein [Flavobacteriaceae]|jgi:hypothetical protein|uniref:Uncharacterized protein n=1 Tax=Mesoflavibacter zeaxanthinifaciens subsp. sabulilitoris TaxID=1520893 RepID=A0A2T1NKU2_9FLAO|nr:MULTISPECIES: hypothetical protein [Flavobacteriaceae]MBB3122513.1 hypothetical protein [Mesoflavibacter zeaxanthinifaciens subsp. sabulilitoris]PSG93527.1 hypothetical protein C7H61_03170 [Mesoflavibacter zeaxanthinifaciens subsp. sabulilitoris]TVZ49855.1 hypothetical protein JM82_0294 [Olleya sp. Hel_I_94]
MTEFTERYKKLSNAELLEILANSKNYQPIAVETAEKEFENRNLSKIEINKAKSEIKSKQEEKLNIIEKRRQTEVKVKETAFKFFDTINPIQNEIQTPEKIIRLTTLIIGGLAIFSIFKQFSMLKYMFTDGLDKWDLGMLEYFFPLILLPLSIILFWKRKKIGWILLSIFLSYSAVNSLIFFFKNLGRQPSGIPALESLFPSVSPIVYLMNLLFFGGTLWLICKEDLRHIYKISKQTMFLTIVLTTVITLILIYAIIG